MCTKALTIMANMNMKQPEILIYSEGYYNAVDLILLCECDDELNQLNRDNRNRLYLLYFFSDKILQPHLFHLHCPLLHSQPAFMFITWPLMQNRASFCMSLPPSDIYP